MEFNKTHKRFNPLTEEWVLVSPHRTKRPWQGKQEDSVNETSESYNSSCYLCPGNRRANGDENPNYDSTFTFTNDFAALLPEQAKGDLDDRLLRANVEEGICKVVCFSPDHSLTMAKMTVEDIHSVVKLWKEQFVELASQPSINNVQIFENKGEIMGCSNPHPHGQIWAQSSVPNEIAKKTRSQNDYFEQHSSSLLGDYLLQELESRERVVCENEYFVCLVPFWAVWPYETMIIPRRHFRSIDEISGEEERGFAQILSEITIRYDNLFETSFPYSAGMQQRPTDGNGDLGWHFHYSFYPPLLRSATVKKFMVGYEMFANPQRDITAEQAAQILRDLSIIHYKKA
ncbi:UDP-glucose--hexose-1-phosphate uridylyltransferase [Ekhidna sp.]